MKRALLFAVVLTAPIYAGCGSGHSNGGSSGDDASRTVIVLNEDDQRSRLGHYARVLLGEGRYDRIEAIEESLRVTGACWPSGAPKFVSFAHRGFQEVDDPADAEQWETHLAGLRQWGEARPQSALAPIALAEGVLGRAFAARGSGWAKDVSADEWRRMEADVDEAAQLLRQCPKASREHVLWHEAMLLMLHGQGVDADAAYRRHFAEAIETFPMHYRFYTNAAIHLMPRWYGEPGELAKILEEATNALPDPIGDEYYARVMTDLSKFSTNIFLEHEGISWKRARRGLQLWQSRDPGSVRARSSMAMVAGMAGHQSFARQAFRALGDTLDLEVWNSRATYDRFRAIAFDPQLASR